MNQEYTEYTEQVSYLNSKGEGRECTLFKIKFDQVTNLVAQNF